MNPVVLLTGVPAAGKSTVATKLRTLRRDIRLVDGDAIVREAGRGILITPATAQQVADLAFSRLLRRVHQDRQRGPVVVDSALPASMLIRARDELGPDCSLVGLRITEEERARRQADRDRQDRFLASATDVAALTPLAEEALGLCDVVLDANGPRHGGLSPKACAGAILDHLESLDAD